MYTKLQALELSKEWLDRYRDASVECDECPWCGSPVVSPVADRLEREIIMERQREKEAARAAADSSPELRQAPQPGQSGAL